MESFIHSTIFDEIHPLSFNVFTIKNPVEANAMLYAPNLKVSVLDSTTQVRPPLVGAVIVPRGREDDPLYSTREGQNLMLERFFGISRLFVVANNIQDGVAAVVDESIDEGQRVAEYKLFEINAEDQRTAENAISVLLRSFLPVNVASSETRYLSYTDGLVCKMPVSHLEVVPFGLGYITDEIICLNKEKYELRRRLRFSNTQNFIHYEVRMTLGDKKYCNDPKQLSKMGISHHEHDMTEVLEPHWKEMCFGINSAFLMTWKNQKDALSTLNGKAYRRALSILTKEKKQRKCLCFGLLGAAVLHFLETKVGCKVIMVDNYITTAHAVMDLFGASNLKTYGVKPMAILDEYNTPQPNPMKNLAEFRNENFGRFDLLLIDLHEFNSGWSAPPTEWMTIETLVKMKNLLTSNGIVVLRFIQSDYFTLLDFVGKMSQVFWKVLKIKVSEKSFVLVGIFSSNDVSTSVATVEELVQEFTEEHI